MTNNPFLSLTALDADPRVILRLDELHAARRRAALQRLGETLSGGGAATLGGRAAALVVRSPEIAGSPSIWQWLLQVVAAIRASDSSALQALGAHLARFEAAAAAQTQSSWEGWIPPGRGGVAVLPGVDLCLDVGPAGRDLCIDDGVVEDGRPLPATAGWVLDPFDEYAMARGAAEFEYPLAPRIESLSSALTELKAVECLGEDIAPALIARFRSRLIPVKADGNQARAATHEGIPGMTFISFGRRPGETLATLAHEEAHAILNAAESVLGLPLAGGIDLVVPWRPDPRPLAAVLHGIAAFGRMAHVDWRLARRDGCPAAEERYRQRAGWVSEASANVLLHAPSLSSDIREWLESARQDLGAPRDAPQGIAPVIRDLAESGRHAPYRWRLVGDLVSAAEAARLHILLARRPWCRQDAGFIRQFSTAVEHDGRPDAERGLLDRLRRDASDILAGLLHHRVRLMSMIAHRMFSGDSIGTHTDAGARDLVGRVVVGLTPLWDDSDGGELALCENGTAVLTSPLSIGTALAFEISERSQHQVLPVRGPIPRTTLVLSFAHE